MEKTQESPNVSLPIISVAALGLDALEKSYKIDASIYRLPETSWDLKFKRKRENVEICSTVNNSSAIVLYDEAFSAFNNFSRRVRSFLFEYVPELGEHKIWGEWMKHGKL